MSEHAPKPALASLPIELIEMISPYHLIKLDVPLYHTVDKESLADLRALSQTCYRLRDYALPIIYAQVEVKSIKHLGELHALLKASPSIAPLIKSFRIFGKMDDDCHSTFDLCAEERNVSVSLGDDCVYVNDVSSLPTGAQPYSGTVGERGRFRHDWRRPSDRGGGSRGEGPDGTGEDKLINTPQQFTQCVTELVRMLTKLETFGWETPVMPMPRGVFDALKGLPEPLTDLRLVFSSYRGNFCDLPLWELAGQLRSLHVEREQHESMKPPCPIVERDEEATIEAIEAEPLAYSAYMDWARNDERRAREAVHFRIAERTVIAAAQGGNLRTLDPSTAYRQDYQYWAKIKALMPYWLDIEDWGTADCTEGYWEGAAVDLRRFFAHASRHRDWITPNGPNVRIKNTLIAKQHRLISQKDLRDLQLFFAAREGRESEVADVVQHFWPFCEYYLPLLIEDTKLGQQMLDAWCHIVERGEADKVKCGCQECRSVQG